MSRDKPNLDELSDACVAGRLRYLGLVVERFEPSPDEAFLVKIANYRRWKTVDRSDLVIVD